MTPLVTQSTAERRLKADRLAKLYALPDQQADLDQDMQLAGAEVWSMVGRRYAVPVTDADALLSLNALALDLFELLAMRRGPGSEVPPKVADAAKEARAHLKLIAEGKMTLVGAQALAENPDAGGDAITFEANEPEFNRENFTY